jgi:hypothetical protein
VPPTSLMPILWLGLYRNVSPSSRLKLLDGSSRCSVSFCREVKGYHRHCAERWQLHPPPVLSNFPFEQRCGYRNSSRRRPPHVVLSQLTNLLQPKTLDISNDSWQHRHHTAMRESGGGDGETRNQVKLPWYQTCWS